MEDDRVLREGWGSIILDWVVGGQGKYLWENCF